MSADDLKPLDQLCTADPRHSAFVVLDLRTGTFRPKTVEDHYSAIESIRLNDSVPPEVQIHFETARNLLLYAWFAYRFIPVAELQAYASLEYALRVSEDQQGQGDFGKRKGLKKLLADAVKQGWIRDNEIRQYRRIEERRMQSDAVIQEIFGNERSNYASNVQTYASVLAETIPSLRNELAHGSSMLTLMSNAYLTLEICCDLINQLFPAEHR